MELLHSYSNNPAYLIDLPATLKTVSHDDPKEDEPALGGAQSRAGRGWSIAERLAADGVREIVERYREGKTARELAEKFSVSHSSVKRILRVNGVRRRAKSPN